MDNEFYLLFLGLGGVLVFIINRIRSLKLDFAAGNKEFIWSKFWEQDWPTFALSTIFVVMAYFTREDWIRWIQGYYPKSGGLTKVLFVMIGINGTYLFALIQGLFKATTKIWIRKVHDVKSNIADKVTTGES